MCKWQLHHVSNITPDLKLISSEFDKKWNRFLHWKIVPLDYVGNQYNYKSAHVFQINYKYVFPICFENKNLIIVLNNKLIMHLVLLTIMPIVMHKANFEAHRWTHKRNLYTQRYAYKFIHIYVMRSKANIAVCCSE